VGGRANVGWEGGLMWGGRGTPTSEPLSINMPNWDEGSWQVGLLKFKTLAEHRRSCVPLQVPSRHP